MDYSWSSATAYVRDETNPIVTVEHNPYWKRLGKEDECRRKKLAPSFFKGNKIFDPLFQKIS